MPEHGAQCAGDNSCVNTDYILPAMCTCAATLVSRTRRDERLPSPAVLSEQTEHEEAVVGLSVCLSAAVSVTGSAPGTMRTTNPFLKVIGMPTS